MLPFYITHTMKEIKEWLQESNDYTIGLALFVKHSRNRAKIGYLQRKCDPTKLRYELERLLEFSNLHEAPPVPQTLAAQAQPAQNPAPDDEPTKPHERLQLIGGGKIVYANLPPVLQGIYHQACEEHSLIRSLHEKMKLVGTDSMRAELRAQLDKLDDSSKEKFAIIDHWVATGELPDNYLTDPTDNDPKAAPSPKELNAARTSISRNLQLISKDVDDARRTELLERLRSAVAVVNAADCSFGKNAEALATLQLIPSAKES